MPPESRRRTERAMNAARLLNQANISAQEEVRQSLLYCVYPRKGLRSRTHLLLHDLL